MQRSTGVTATSVLLFIGGGFLILVSLLEFVGFLFVLQKGSGEISQLVLLFFLVVIVIEICIGSWAIAMGIGLLKLRNWARISLFVFAGIVLFFTVPGMFIYLIMGLAPQNDGHDLPPPFFWMAMAVFYSLLTSLAIWWLYFFNTRAVKEQFGAKSYPIAPPLPLPPQDSVGLARLEHRRPISITVIAALLLVSAASGSSALFLIPFFQLPTILFGFIIQGSGVVALLLAFMGVQTVAGIGLLKLRPWARTLAIWYFAFTILNGLVDVLRPGNLVRLEKIMIATLTKIIPLPASENFFRFPSAKMLTLLSVIGLFFGIAFCGVQLWFLIREKRAFLETNQSQASVP